MAFWSDIPEATGVEMNPQEFRHPQGPRTGLNCVMGRMAWRRKRRRNGRDSRGNLVIQPDDLILLDTNILIEFFRNRARGRWLKRNYLGTLRLRPLLSIVSVGELDLVTEKGDYKPEQVAVLDERINEARRREREPSGGRLVFPTCLDCEKRGRQIGQNDTWIAATAAATGSTGLNKRHRLRACFPSSLC